MRLLNWPAGLGFVAMSALSGPRVRGEGTDSTTGFVQTTASPFGLLEWELSLLPMRDRMARAYRGMVTALHGGANAVRVPFSDPDKMFPAEAGMTGVDGLLRPPAVPFSNEQPFSNGQLWAGSYPLVAVASAAARDTTIVSLASTTWGHRLNIGDRFGFMPFHFGVYQVTEVIAAGTYRVWPQLRAAITTASYATIEPTLAMRLRSEAGASINRGVAFMEGASIRLVEVPDYTIRQAVG